MQYLNYLPIWRDANRLLVAVERAARQFPRYYKDTLGSDRCRQAMTDCRLILRATDSLGHIVRPHDRLGRRRVIGNLSETYAAFERVDVGACRLRLPSAPFERLSTVLASFLGRFTHADADRVLSVVLTERP